MAGKNARGLLVIGLFVLAVLVVIVSINLLVYLLYVYGPGSPTAPSSIGRAKPLLEIWQVCALVSLFVLAPILLGIFAQANQLSSGGPAVAQILGAERVDRRTSDPFTRRLIILVEELAPAAQLAVPRIAVMEREKGVNAFSAGYAADDALLAVTRGALDRLTREELRGVVAHQLSHIAGGEARLNMILISLLAGLVSVSSLGRYLTNMDWLDGVSPLRGRLVGFTRLAISMVIGFVLRLFGSLGVLLARAIRLFHARHLVFLADANAVALTGSRDGIGGALRKIGSISDPYLSAFVDRRSAEVLSHLFLCEPGQEPALGFPAHPSLSRRIARIYGEPRDIVPAPDLPFPSAELHADLINPIFATPRQTEVAIDENEDSEPGAAVEPLPRVVGTVSPAPCDIATIVDRYVWPTEIVAAQASSSCSAQLILALFVVGQTSAASAARQVIVDGFGDDDARQVDRYRSLLADLPPDLRIPLLEKTVPGLESLSDEHIDRLRRVAHRVVVADARIGLEEFMLYSVLESGLDRMRKQPQSARYPSLDNLRDDTALILSFIAYLRDPLSSARVFRVSGLPGSYQFVAGDQIDLGVVSESLERLAGLAPAAKKSLIRAATAIAFFDGLPTRESVNSVRMLCAAMDIQLPPQLLADDDVDRSALGSRPEI